MDREAAAQTLTARFEAMPKSHDVSEFTFELHFSEEIEMSFVNMRDDVLDVTGGVVKGARRLTAGSKPRLADYRRAGFGGGCVHLAAADSRLRGGKCGMYGGQPSPVERASSACARSARSAHQCGGDTCKRSAFRDLGTNGNQPRSKHLPGEIQGAGGLRIGSLS